MRIAVTQVGDCLIADGINVFIYELSDALIHLGHEIYLVSGLAANVPVNGNISAFERAVREMFAVENVPRLVSLSFHSHARDFLTFSMQQNARFTFKGSETLNRISPDMVIFNGVTTTWCPHFKVAVNHDMQFRISALKYYDMLMYRTFDKLVATCTELKQGLIKQFHLPQSKISVIPICVDTSRFSSRVKNERQHIILHVGTRPEKRPETTIKAFARIAETDPEVKLFVAGQIAPRQLDGCISGIREESIRQRIVILGRVSKEKLADLYAQAKVTCVPSDYNVPVCSPTVIESLASGTPVVGSIAAISQDILVDGYSGYRVYPNDVEMFAGRLNTLITDDELWAKMSKNSLAIAQRCDKTNVAKEYVSLYNESAR